MPNQKVLEEKKLVVQELTEKLKSQAGVFVDYSGINVNEDTKMRVKLREANIEYTVVKNTLMKLAIKNVGFEELDPIFNGTTSLAISNDDPVAPARVIKEFADGFSGFFEIKGGFMDGKVLSLDEVVSLASIPPLQVLYAQLLGTMLAPISSLAIVVKAASEKDGDTVQEETSEIEETAEPEETVAAEAAEETTQEAVEEAATEEAAAEETVAEEAAEVAADEAVAEESVDSSENEESAED